MDTVMLKPKKYLTDRDVQEAVKLSAKLASLPENLRMLGTTYVQALTDAYEIVQKEAEPAK